MSKIKQLNNGINTFTNDANKTMHQCMYCETWFYPKRRFMQKYCSESCRVLACRHRKQDLFGMRGGQISDREKTTNSHLYEEVKELKRSILEMNKTTNFNVQSASTKQTEMTLDMQLRLLEIQSEQKKAMSLQKWQMFLNVVMPLVSPSVIEMVKNIFSSDKPIESLEEFNKHLDPILKDMPSDLRDSLMNSAKMYYNALNIPFKP